MSEQRREESRMSAEQAEQLRQFGDGWSRYFGRDPDEVVTYGSTQFRLGDFATVSPGSIPAFSRFGAMLQDPSFGPEHPATQALHATLEQAFVTYAGPVPDSGAR